MDILVGRLGNDTARIPHSGRHGIVWLARGALHVENGCVVFTTAGSDDLRPGTYALPHQTVSAILLQPGTTVSHDALRILAGHGTCLMAVGDGGVRMYTAPPLMPDVSSLARTQVRLWSDPETRLHVARRMYAKRFGEILPYKDIEVLRGMEGQRVKVMYEKLARRYGVVWTGRKFDRNAPSAADDANKAINLAATAVYAAAAVAVYSVGAIPQLGFIHEDSGEAFCLDVADIYRTDVTVPIAFEAVSLAAMDPSRTLDGHVRRIANRRLKEGGLIDGMIDLVKELLDADD